MTEVFSFRQYRVSGQLAVSCHQPNCVVKLTATSRSVQVNTKNNGNRHQTPSLRKSDGGVSVPRDRVEGS